MKFLARWRTRKASDDPEAVYVSERYGVRSLHIGSDTIQSSMRLSRPNDLELSYTRSMMAFLLFMAKPRSALMIGLGGGSLAKFFHHRMAEVDLTIVEVNPHVVAIARRYFHVPDDEASFRVLIEDGAAYVRRGDVAADVLLVDGYEADAHVEELASASFYSACRERLKPGGIAAVNLWSGGKLFRTLLQRIREAFAGAILCLPAERPGNVIVFGFRTHVGAIAWTALRARAASLESLHDLEYGRFVEGFRKMNRHDDEMLYL